MWYLDEAGINKDERFAVVGGFSIDDEQYDEILSNFRQFKQKFLPDATRKLDMKRLVRGKGWCQGISLQQRKVLLVEFYKFLSESNIRIVISMIDRDSSPNIRDKLQFAYECLFERICLNMDDINKKKKKTELGILFYDNNGIKDVAAWFKNFYVAGTTYVINHNLIEAAIPLQMSQSELLQISDMIICTYSYLLKAQAGQKTSQWLKETLEEGNKVIRTKAKRVRTQDGYKLVSSIKEYSI